MEKERESHLPEYIKATDRGLSVLHFTDFKKYLMQVGFPGGLYQHRGNSVDKWAKRLGYKSPSSLTMVLNGTRLPSRDMTKALIKDLRLAGKEKEYFELLIDYEREKKRSVDSNETLDRLTILAKEGDYFQVDMQTFKAISKWYYYVIKQLVASKDFSEDTNWIYLKLKKKVTPRQIRHAIDDLLQLQIIFRDENGKLSVSKTPSVTTNDVPSKAIRQYHAEMLERTIEALEEQSVDKRHMSALTFKMDRDRVPEAKKVLFEFLKEFNERFSEDEDGDVFQLGLQLFSHTK